MLTRHRPYHRFRPDDTSQLGMAQRDADVEALTQMADLLASATAAGESPAAAAFLRKIARVLHRITPRTYLQALIGEDD